MEKKPEKAADLRARIFAVFAHEGRWLGRYTTVAHDMLTDVGDPVRVSDMISELAMAGELIVTKDDVFDFPRYYPWALVAGPDELAATAPRYEGLPWLPRPEPDRQVGSMSWAGSRQALPGELARQIHDQEGGVMLWHARSEN